MRYFTMILAVLMVLFAAVQYNDPDGLMWMFIYFVPAIWALLAVIWPALLRARLGSLLLNLCIVLSVLGTLYFWPQLDYWWQQEVFLQEIVGESAREGMGMMVVFLVLIIIKIGNRQRN